LLVFVGLMWLVWLLDALTPGTGSAAGIGIVPRTFGGLDGIAVAPFIHGNFQHLLSNSIPLLILGAVILLRGLADFLFVVLVSGLIGGFGTWLFGTGNAQHIGASGIVFGFFGYLVFRTAFDRRLSSAAITLAVAIGYGTAMVFALVPQESVSWSGHFFGFAGGFVAARVRYPARRASSAVRPARPMRVLLALILTLGASGAWAAPPPPYRPLPALDLKVFACAPDPTHQLFSSRAELAAFLDGLAAHCPAPQFQQVRTAFLRSLDRASVRWADEALVIVQDWYGTGMAKASLRLTSPSPDVVRAAIVWRVPPPPVTPDTVVYRFAFVVKKPKVARVEVTGRTPKVTVLRVRR
jgi:membrane associated rhomboid family serine protease